MTYPEELNNSGEGDEEEIQEEEEVNFQEVASVLDVGDGFDYLPKHQHCACHLLNLVSTVDAFKANSNEAYKKSVQAAFSKSHTLWNKSRQSALAAETIKDACKLQLIRPNATRWNSMFLAVERIVRIVREQGEGAIRDVCTSFKIPMRVLYFCLLGLFSDSTTSTLFKLDTPHQLYCSLSKTVPFIVTTTYSLNCSIATLPLLIQLLNYSYSMNLPHTNQPTTVAPL